MKRHSKPMVRTIEEMIAQYRQLKEALDGPGLSEKRKIEIKHRLFEIKNESQKYFDITGQRIELFKTARQRTAEGRSEEEILALYDQAKTISEMSSGETDQSIGFVFLEIATFYKERSRQENALRYFESALNIFLHLNETTFPKKQWNSLISDIFYEIGVLQSQLEDTVQDALNSFGRSLALREKNLGMFHSQVGVVLDQMATIYLKQDKLSLAFETYSRALEIYEKMEDTPVTSENIAQILNRLIVVCVTQKKPKKALNFCIRAMEILKRLNQENSVFFGNILINTGAVHTKLNQHLNALIFYQKALEIFKKQANAGKIVASISTNIGDIFLRENRLDEALSYFIEALKILKLSKGRSDLDSSMASVLDNMGEIFKEKKRFEQAILQYAAALEFIQKVYPPSHSAVCFMKYNLAKCYMEAFSHVPCEKTEEYRRKAILYFQENIKIDHEYIQAQRKLYAFDYIAHLKMVKQCSIAYCFGGDFLEAANLYRQEAQLLFLISPLMALFCIRCALKNLKYVPASDVLRAEMYELEAKIYLKRKQYIQAICAIQKSIDYQPTESRENLLEIAKKMRKEAQEKMGSYLYSQLESCQEAFVELQFSLYKDLKKDDSVSECTKNKIVELFVKLRNVLDQVFYRSVKELVLKPNEELSKDIYFPVRDSEDEVCDQLKRARVLVPEQPGKKQFNLVAPKSFDKMMGEQSFVYYQSQRNKGTQIWRQSWLTELDEIANQGKHVELGALKSQSDLTEVVGMIEKERLTVSMRYHHLYLHEWSFVGLLSNVSEIEDGEIWIRLSAEIYKILTENGYVSRGKIVLSKMRLVMEAVLLDEVLLQQKINTFEALIKNDMSDGSESNVSTTMQLLIEAMKPSLDVELFQNRMNAFEAMIKHDLPTSLQPYASAISKFLVVQILPQGPIELDEPNADIDVVDLLERSLEKVFEMAETFAEELPKEHLDVPPRFREHAVIQSSSTVTEVSEKKEKEADQYQRDMEILRSASSFHLKTIQDHSHSLKQLVYLYQQTGRVKEAAELYHQSADVLKERAPWLALIYQKRAIQQYKRTRSDNEETKTLYQERDTLLTKMGLFRKMSDKEKTEAQKDHSVFLGEFSTMDPDIASQWAYLQEKHALFLYRSFQFSMNPDDPFLSLQLENLFAEMMVKLRGVLEQSYTKFIQQKIYGPNQETGPRLICFPCAETPDEFNAFLREIHILNGKGNASVTDFEEVWKVLQQVQPFSSERPVGESWLALLKSISNHVKHVGLLRGRYTPHQEIERVYTVLFSTPQRSIAIPSGVLVKEIMERVHKTIGTLLKVTQTTVLAAPLVPTVSM